MAQKHDTQAMLKQKGTTYPEVTNLSSDVRKKVNTIIRKTAYKAIPDYNPGTPVIEAHSQYTTPVNRNNILSLRFQDDYYPEMAAHGVTGVSSVTLNLANGHYYKFKELFRSNSDYQEVIDQIIQAQIISRQIPMLKPFEGVGANEDYYLTADNLVIYYQPYVYTPGYFGVLEFVIPYEQIMNIIDMQGPIGKII